METWSARDGSVVAHCGGGPSRYWVDLPGLARFSLDGEGMNAVRYAPVADAALVDAYQRRVLPLIVQAMGLEVLHASGIVTVNGVVAFCGDTGSGKSTMVFALGRRGYKAWADDALAVLVTPATIVSHPLPFQIRLRAPSASFFGLGDIEEGRAPGPDSAAPFTEVEPLAALCVLQRAANGEEAPAITRLSRTSAFSTLLPHAYCFSLKEAAIKRRIVQRYLDLAARIPVFEVRFPPRFDVLPGVLDSVEGMVDRLVVAS